MNRHDDRISLADMLIYATKAVVMIGETSPDELERNEMQQLALRKLVEIVGEAANRVSPTTQQRHPEIPWPQIIGMRNRLIHGYDVVNLNILWDTITNELPLLIEQLQAIVGAGDSMVRYPRVRILNKADIMPVIERALTEDVGDGDITTKWTVPLTKQAKAKIIARADGVIAGLDVARWVFEAVEESIVFKADMKDGERVVDGDVLAEVSGPARGLLTGERVALNFLQRMSGIATMTAQFVEAVKGTQTRILDTRKTAPGLRLLDKYAVSTGGGVNHRVGLFDMVLMKENHIEAADGIGPALLSVWKGMDFEGREVPVEVEVETLSELDEVLVLGADRVMLDNMSLDEMCEAVEKVRKLKGKRPELEASGNVSLDSVRAIAETGVDLISVGALTHSVKALDISMLFR